MLKTVHEPIRVNPSRDRFQNWRSFWIREEKLLLGRDLDRYSEEAYKKTSRPLSLICDSASSLELLLCKDGSIIEIELRGGRFANCNPEKLEPLQSGTVGVLKPSSLTQTEWRERNLGVQFATGHTELAASRSKDWIQLIVGSGNADRFVGDENSIIYGLRDNVLVSVTMIRVEASSMRKLYPDTDV